MSSLPSSKSHGTTSNGTYSPILLHPQHRQQIPSTSQTLNHQDLQWYALNSSPRHRTHSIHSLSHSRNTEPTSQQATDSQSRLPKRRMDLNSQLQAAVSYHAAMNGNVPMNMNGSLHMNSGMMQNDQDMEMSPPIKKARTNTPWTPEEEKRLKELRDLGASWSEIAKSFPNRTEGSVKKHWYKDMHYAEFTDDEKELLFDAIREYDANKWKTIGNKVGKPAKACEQFAREHYNGR